MNSNYPSNWDTLRRLVYRRDGYTCQNCGVKGGSGPEAEDVELHAHHIVPVSKGGTHKPSNLKTLCKRCHDSVHQRNTFAPTWSGDGCHSNRSVKSYTSNDVENKKVLLGVLLILVLGFSFITAITEVIAFGVVSGIAFGVLVLIMFGLPLLFAYIGLE